MPGDSSSEALPQTNEPCLSKSVSLSKSKSKSDQSARLSTTIPISISMTRSCCTAKLDASAQELTPQGSRVRRRIGNTRLARVLSSLRDDLLAGEDGLSQCRQRLRAVVKGMYPTRGYVISNASHLQYRIWGRFTKFGTDLGTADLATVY